MTNHSFWCDLRSTVLVVFGVVVGAIVFNTTCTSNHSPDAATTNVTSITAGNGITATPNPIVETGTIELNFGGNGSATTTSRSDHNHDTAYPATGHNHDASYSATTHNHDAAYSATTHNHDATYSATAHNHDSSYAAILGFSQVLTSEATSSTTYADLATVGPSVAFNLSAAATVYVEFGAYIDAYDYMGYVSISVDGVAATDSDNISVGYYSSDEHMASCARILKLDLAAGAHTVTLKYRADQASDEYFAKRWIRIMRG